MLIAVRYGSNLWALVSDPDQPITIDSNAATYDNVTATCASDFIEYDSKRSLVKAGEKTSDAKRVHILLRPKEITEIKTDAKLTDNTSGKAPDQNRAVTSPAT